MHELFLSTSVNDDDLERALRVLQGYCGMKPVTFLRRRLLWEGPRMRNNLKGIDAAFLRNQEKTSRENGPLWRTLHEQLVRNSYIITLIYDVNRDDFGRNEDEADEEGEQSVRPHDGLTKCDLRLGTLRWTDIPDPAGARPVNSRPIVNIGSQYNLCSALKAMNHRFTGEMVQECHRFVLNDVVFDLSRYLQLPPSDTEPASSIRSQLPSFESLKPFDPENKWVLTASALVFNGNIPDQMQQGIDELMQVKTDFQGCLNLKALDRHALDTRLKV